MIVLGQSREYVEKTLTSCRVAGHITNSYGVRNEESEDHPDIFCAARHGCLGPSSGINTKVSAEILVGSELGTRAVRLERKVKRAGRDASTTKEFASRTLSPLSMTVCSYASTPQHVCSGPSCLRHRFMAGAPRASAPRVAGFREVLVALPSSPAMMGLPGTVS